MSDYEHSAAHDRNAEATAARHKAMVAHGFVSEAARFECVAAPGTDGVSVVRHGAEGHPLTVIAVAVNDCNTSMTTYLTPMTARAMALALLTRADEADGAETEFALRVTNADAAVLGGVDHD